jgi:hypothetical protein
MMTNRELCVVFLLTNYNDAEKHTLIIYSEVDEGDEFFKRRKYKLSHKKKKKKKKLLLKILFGVAVFYLAHLLYFKFFPAVRRRERFKLLVLVFFIYSFESPMSLK